MTLVDRMNHHLFQPLLYQAALGGLSESDCASPVRAALRRAPNTRFVMAEVTDVDARSREVVLERGERLGYDSLIVACGAETSYFGHDEWKDVSCGLKTLADVIELRNRVFTAFEEAERAQDDTTRSEWATFVVIGGGPTGVEVAGQLALTARTMKHGFRRSEPAGVRVILLDAGDRLVTAFSEKLSAKVATGLNELGVTVREGARATAIDSRGVTVEVGGASERIDSRTVIWAAGVQAVPLTVALAARDGSRTRPRRSNRGDPRADGARACGDLRDRRRGEPAPDRAGDRCPAWPPWPSSRHITWRRGFARARAAPRRRSSYLDKGALAVIGRERAVCEIRGLKLSGPPRLPHLSGGAPLLPGRPAGPPPRGADQVDWRAFWPASERIDR